jgi:hypothetical protein
MSPVLELFRNFKTKKKNHEESFEVVIQFVKKLQFQNLSHIVYSPFFIWTLYKQGVWSSNFTLKNVCTWDEPFKRFNLKQKKNYAQFKITYLPNLPIYLAT